MNTLRIQTRRKSRPHVEQLDSIIAPTAMGAAALATEIRVETRQVSRWETALASARPGSHRESSLNNHIARTEGRMAVQEARLAQLDAAQLARMKASNLGRSANAVTPQTVVVHPSTVSANPTPVVVNSPVMAPVTPPTLSTTSSGPTTGTTTTTPAPQSSLPANVSQTLSAIYSAYEQDPSAFPANVSTISGASMVVIDGTNVGIQVKDNNAADFNTLVNELQGAGMQITNSSAVYGTVVGLLPIAQLPTVAAFADASSIGPQYVVALK